MILYAPPEAVLSRMREGRGCGLGAAGCRTACVSPTPSTGARWQIGNGFLSQRGADVGEQLDELRRVAELLHALEAEADDGAALARAAVKPGSHREGQHTIATFNQATRPRLRYYVMPNSYS